MNDAEFRRRAHAFIHALQASPNGDDELVVSRFTEELRALDAAGAAESGPGSATANLIPCANCGRRPVEDGRVTHYQLSGACSGSVIGHDGPQYEPARVALEPIVQEVVNEVVHGDGVTEPLQLFAEASKAPCSCGIEHFVWDQRRGWHCSTHGCER